MEESVKELKGDLRNARELINCLTDTVKALKSGRDEDLHRKMDEILSQQHNQRKLEKKMDSLREEFIESRKEMANMREEIKHVVEQVRNSKEMKHIADSVETSVGYLELFVKDFENIHTRIQEIDTGFLSKFGDISKEIGSLKKETQGIQTKLAQHTEKLDALRNDMSSSIDEQRTLLNKIDNLESGTKNTMDSLLRIEDKLVKNEEEPPKSQNVPLKADNDRDPKNLDQKDERQPGNLKCWNCKNVLPDDTPLKEDGVSVKCDHCNYTSIVCCLKKGHQWMCGNFYFGGCTHHQQFPIGTTMGVKANCFICGTGRNFRHANRYMALRC